MFHHQEINASFAHSQDLVLEFRLPHKMFKRSPTLMLLLGLLVIACVGAIVFFSWQLWQLVVNNPDIKDKLTNIDWGKEWDRFIHNKKTSLYELFLILSMVPFQFWVMRCMSKSKLIFNQTHLMHQSGFPRWIGNLTKQNWSLSLQDLRNGKPAFTLAGQNWASNPILTYALQWKSANGLLNSMAMKRLNLAAWFLPGESAREPIKLGSLWVNLAPWKTSEGQALLQNAFDQLPLIVALRARGVPIPAISSVKRHHAGDGIDLFAYPRLKAGIFAFFGLLVSAGLGYHFMRHQHFFEPVSILVWAVVGVASTVAMWMWLAQEQDAQEKSLKASQGLIAVLVGIGCTLVAPSALSAANLMLYPKQSISAKLSHNPLSLQPQDASVPAFSPATAYEFWGSLKSGSVREMTVRQGLFGTWQYDSKPMEEEVYSFYAKQPRP